MFCFGDKKAETIFALSIFHVCKLTEGKNSANFYFLQIQYPIKV